MNVRSHLAGALLAATAVLCLPSSSTATLSAQSPPRDLAKKVDAYLAPLAAIDLFRGSVLIAKGGKVLFERSYGEARLGTPVTSATQFKLLSISKTLTTALLMRYVQDGKLQLDDPVGKHLPGWPAAWAAVTVHQLLEHRSGLPVLQNEWETAQRRSGRGRRAWADFAPTLQQSALLAPAGKEHRYNNWNHEVVGLIQEQLADADFCDLLQTELLAPLGMTGTRCDDGRPHALLADGHRLERDGSAVAIPTDLSQLVPSVGICSTTADLHRFDRALAKGEFLTAATQKVMFTARHGDHACSWLIQTIAGRPCQRHSGGVQGYALDLLRFPADDACVILLGNLGFAPTVRMAEDLAALLFGKPAVQPQVGDAAAAQRCNGVFEGPDGQLLALRGCGTRLIRFLLKANDEQVDGQVLLPLGKDTFVEGAGDVSLALLRKGAQLRRTAAGNTTTWRRSREVAATWEALAGTWRTTPDLGSAELQVTEGGIVLNFAQPPAVPIVPISETRALLLYDPPKATLMSRDGDVLRCRIGETDFVLRLQR